jgi:hypothetical protein
LALCDTNLLYGGRAPMSERENGPAKRIILREFPLRLMDQARQHSEALIREFQLLVHADPETAHVPRRLLELAEESDKRYSGMNPQAEDIVEAALARGDEYVDLEVFVPVSFKRETLEAVPILLEVEEYCRNGQMLTLVPSEDLRAFWEWYLGEFVRQIDGLAPIGWRERPRG